MQGSRTELRECPQLVQLYPNPWCSHLQSNRLGAEEEGFLVGVHEGASWQSVCGVHQVWPLGHNGEPVARTSWSAARYTVQGPPCAVKFSTLLLRESVAIFTGFDLGAATRAVMRKRRFSFARRP